MSYEKMPALASDEQRVPADARFVERKSGGARDRLLGRVEGTSMSARRLALATGALVLVLAVGAVSVSALPLGTAANPERIDLITRATAINNFVDVAPRM